MWFTNDWPSGCPVTHKCPETTSTLMFPTGIPSETKEDSINRAFMYAIDKVVRLDDNILPKEMLDFPLSKPRSLHR